MGQLRLLFPLLHACNKGSRRRLHAGEWGSWTVGLVRKVNDAVVKKAYERQLAQTNGISHITTGATLAETLPSFSQTTVETYRSPRDQEHRENRRNTRIWRHLGMGSFQKITHSWVMENSTIDRWILDGQVKVCGTWTPDMFMSCRSVNKVSW